VTLDCWDIDPSLVPHQRPLEKIVPRADAVFLTVPSSCLRRALHSIAPHLSKKTVVVTCAKGMERHSKKTADQIMIEILPRAQQCAVIGGPMIAEELRAGRTGYGVVAARSTLSCALVQGLFRKTSLYLGCSSDMRGVALCGVLKNIYAIGLGIVDGLNLGDNTRGAVVMKAIREMMIIVPILGGKKDTVLGCAGVGDLVATGSSPHSSNYMVGRQRATSRVCNRHSEGRLSIETCAFVLRKELKRLPFFCMIKDVLSCKKDARQAFTALFVLTGK
jgi:glycerol-3-phosphate dehydrogenase (NAD(P)+)